MKDWLKVARELQVSDAMQSVSPTDSRKKQDQESLDLEKDWMERVSERVADLARELIYIGVIRTSKGLELKSRGKVDIQFREHENFMIKYYDIQKPSSVVINGPFKIYHDRVVRVRQLNSHNIEEILKFVALGAEMYIENSQVARIERNLKTLMESVNQHEHVPELETDRRS